MRKRTWTKSQLIKAVASSKSYRQVLLKLSLRQAGGNYSQLKKYIKEYKLNTSHFKGRGWNKGNKLPFLPKIDLKDILIKNSTFQSYKLKKRLFQEGIKPLQCEECGWAKRTKNGRLPLELHHVNGSAHDNRLQNLKILCPNCHSLKPNYRGRNIKSPGGGMVDTRHLKCRE
ncbi:MAG: HNH endonuclease [Parcubacteria group bacterium]|nr:HNH endonuclease [Parcubacteria group bacterium]